MRKKNNNNWRGLGLVPYIRELSIVIIGVLITLLITNILSDRAKQAEVKRALTLVKIELEENLHQIEWGTCC